MRLYDFTIIAAGSPELTDELAERLYEVGADDCSPSSCNHVLSIGFARESESLEAAIRSAIGHMQAAGLTAARVVVEAEDFAAKG